MFGIDDAILGAGLAFGGKLLSGLGAGQSASKANKRAVNLQAFADAQNQKLQENKNLADYDLGQSLIDRADAMPALDTSAWMAAGQAAGFNPVTWLNAGTLSLYDNRATQQAFIGQGTALKSPGVTQYGVASQQAVPSVMSAVGGAISAGADAYSSAVQSQNKLTAAQQGMAGVIAAIQKARQGGNALAGLGTPAFSMAGALVSGGGAAAALSIANKAAKSVKAASSSDDSDTNMFGLKEEPGERTSSLGEFPWKTDPGLPKADTIEDVFGDGLAGSIPSWMLFGMQGYYNVTGGRSFMGDQALFRSWANRRVDGYVNNVLGADRRQAAIDEIRPPLFSGWNSWPEVPGWLTAPARNLPSLGYPSP